MDIFFKKRIFSVRASNGAATNIEVLGADSDGLITTIPAGYMLEFLVFSETGGAAVTIDVGTTAGDDDIISSYAIGSNDVLTQSLGIVFSTTSTQQIFIHSAAWTTAELDIYILLRKL